MINDKLEDFMNLVLKENEKLNLTSILSKKDFQIKHFEDSLLPNKVFDFDNKTIADLGSGAGFPGIPLAILNQNSTFYLIEPTLKRCNFLKKAKDELELKNIEIINSRMEDLKKDFKFDVIVTRAVAPLNIILELSIPYLKVGGIFIAYKGIKGEEELFEAKNALKQLDSSIYKIQKENLSNGDLRINIFIKKERETNLIYPRAYKLIKNKPL